MSKYYIQEEEEINMRIFQISDFHLRGDGKLSFQKADTITAMNRTVEYFLKLKEYELPEFFVVTGDRKSVV